jgi:uncharacterized protein YndB with AHSA1/START domain
MTIDVAIESTIESPPDDVFAAIADLEAWPSWLIASGIKAVRREREGVPIVGERLVVEQNAAGRAGTFDAEVTVVDPGARFALRGRDRDGVTIEIEAVVSEAAESAGRVSDLRWSIRIGLPLRYRVFESMARPQVERAALLDVESLRQRLEAAARH